MSLENTGHSLWGLHSFLWEIVINNQEFRFCDFLNIFANQWHATILGPHNELKKYAITVDSRIHLNNMKDSIANVRLNCQWGYQYHNSIHNELDKLLIGRQMWWAWIKLCVWNTVTCSSFYHSHTLFILTQFPSLHISIPTIVLQNVCSIFHGKIMTLEKIIWVWFHTEVDKFRFLQLDQDQ